MRTTARAAYLMSALAISTTAVLIAAEIGANQPGGLTVHEWGTFTSVAGEDGTTIDWDVLGGKDDLPGFVNNRGYRCFKFRLTAAVRMETPVLYFYSSRALDAHVRVAFPSGLITEWYPQAEYQIDQRSGRDGAVRRLEASLNGLDTSMVNVTGGIEWKKIRIEPDSAPALPRETNPSRYYAARATDSAPLTAGGQHEKFLFYRGVGRFEVPLGARLTTGGSVVVQNAGPDPAPLVMFFENRGGRIGYRTADDLSGSVTLARPSLDRDIPQLRADLENALVAQGLFRKEAEAMFETWRDSWFEEGSRLIYIVPPRAVDAIVPLEIDPLPTRIARVFVGRIELITSETKQAVADAMATNDRAVIDRYGRFLDPILQRIASENPAMTTEITRFRATVASSLAARGECR